MSGFIHSVKVPRLYKVAATVAKQYSEGVAGFKELVYGGKKKHPNLRAIYSLVTALFIKSKEIETLLKRSQILEKESRCDPWLIKVLIVELIWGKKYLVGQSKPENIVRGYEQIFKAHSTDDATAKPQGPHKPRYVRVNTLLLPTEEAIQKFQDDEWVLSKFLDKNDYDGFLQKISNLEEGEFIVDIHIPDLLIFPPRTEFHNHPAYQKGSILLQDKASCLPVHILAPPPGSVALDMCAAPGMKTTHLAAIMKDQGTIYAVEMDSKRYEILENMISTSAATCVKTFNKDVLECSAKDFPDVEYILVDPSCSGTGIAERYYNPEKISDERLRKLAGFQIKILRSALTRYPNVKRVVYSTCSLQPEENEDVVRQVIETNFKFKLVPAKQFITGNWKNFGSTDYGELGAHCLYTRPDDDFTNGFFVAVFERLAEGEENKFFNNKIYSFKRNIDKKERKKQKKLERELRENERNQENINGNGIDAEITEEFQENSSPGDISNDQCVDQTNAVVKKKCKKKKHSEKAVNSDQKTDEFESIPNAASEVESKKKKMKKKKHHETSSEVKDCNSLPDRVGEFLNTQGIADQSGTEKKKKKKHAEKSNESNDYVEDTVQKSHGSGDMSENLENNNETSTKKKKKKKKSIETIDLCNSFEETLKYDESNGVSGKKKKKKQPVETIDLSESFEQASDNKENKKKHNVECIDLSESFEQTSTFNGNNNVTDVDHKKEKRKKHMETIDGSEYIEGGLKESKKMKRKFRDTGETTNLQLGNNNNETITEDPPKKKKNKGKLSGKDNQMIQC